MCNGNAEPSGKRKEGLNGESYEKGKGNRSLGTLNMQSYDSILGHPLCYINSEYNTLLQGWN